MSPVSGKVISRRQTTVEHQALYNAMAGVEDAFIKHILTNRIPCGNLVRSELAFVALAIVAWLTVSHQEKCLFTVS